VEVQDSYMYGEGQKGRGGGGILLLGMDRQRVCTRKTGISLVIFLAREAERLCSPFSRGCTEPSKGRERGRRIALG